MTKKLQVGLFAPLVHRDFRRLFSAHTISAVGDGLQPIALVFVVLEAGGGATDLGLVLAAGSIPTVALGLFGGVWADRFERRTLLAVSDIVRGTCQGLLALLLLTGQAEMWQLITLSVIYGSFRSLFVPAMSGLVPQCVPQGELVKANSLTHTVNTVSQLAGAPLAGVLVAVTNAGVAVAIDSLSFFLSAVFVLRMGLRSQPCVTAASGSMLRDLHGGWREVRSRPWLLTELIRSTFELPLVIAPFYVLGPVIAQERLGGAPAWATITTAFFAGTLAGPLLAAYYRPQRPMLVCTTAMYLGLLPPLLLALTSWTWAIASAELIKGCAVGFFGTVWVTLLQCHIPDGARGRVSAWDFTLTTGLTPVGYLLAVPLTSAFGAGTLLLIGAVYVVLGVTAQLCVPNVRRLQANDNAEAVPLKPLPCSRKTIDEHS